jgi:dihydrodipicolinate synthase/N-acetylneuraminate lyase
MLTARDLRGIMAMMPAFATPDAGDIRATSTVAVDNLKDAVDRIIKDGINVIATTGSFGEFHTLLWPEFETITRATIEVVNKRVPLFIGVTSLNSREVVQKMTFARDAGAEGVLLGVPFYFPSTVENAVRFYHDVAEMFPTLAIMVYHNPVLHNITIPVDAFTRLLENRNVVAMKDSHRDTRQFMNLMRIADGRLSVFVNQLQCYPFAELGAAGFWSYDCWMGPWPMLRLRDAVAQGDVATARQIIFEVSELGIGGTGSAPLSWRETASKLAIQQAGYCDPGPLRPPFVEIPDVVRDRAQKFAAYWQELCARYRPEVEARALASASTPG